MPAMPTTRKGRFEVYRQRARRRNKFLREAKARPSTPGGEEGHSYTRREFNLSAYGKQAPRSYPRRPVDQAWWGGGFAPWRVEPAWRVFGVPEFTPPLHGSGNPANHWPMPILAYVSKRLRSLPKIKALPRRPWRFTLDEIPAGELWPWQFYASGKPNPNWTPP